MISFARVWVSDAELAQGGYMWVFGGEDSWFRASAELLRFDPQTSTWDTISPKVYVNDVAVFSPAHLSLALLGRRDIVGS
jgi:hypothetical protein